MKTRENRDHVVELMGHGASLSCPLAQHSGLAHYLRSHIVARCIIPTWFALTGLSFDILHGQVCCSLYCSSLVNILWSLIFMPLMALHNVLYTLVPQTMQILIQIIEPDLNTSMGHDHQSPYFCITNSARKQLELDISWRLRGYEPTQHVLGITHYLIP